MTRAISAVLSNEWECFSGGKDHQGCIYITGWMKNVPEPQAMYRSDGVAYNSTYSRHTILINTDEVELSVFGNCITFHSEVFRSPVILNRAKSEESYQELLLLLKVHGI